MPTAAGQQAEQQLIEETSGSSEYLQIQLMIDMQSN